MMRVRNWMLVLVVGPLCAGSGIATAEEPNVDGVLGFRSDSVGAYLAVAVAMPADSALSGVRWFNNDGTAAFPLVLAGTGYPEAPGPVEEMQVVGNDVSGISAGWSSFQFSEPIVASRERLYVVYRFPDDSPFEGDGPGGGAAIGYCSGCSAVRGWASGDGGSWMALKSGVGFAVLPVFVAVEPGMLVKSIGDDEMVAPTSFYLEAGPNPFNPSVRIEFGLERRGHVFLEVFDVRGRRVAKLVDSEFASGVHAVIWKGCDDGSRPVASGAYIVRLRSGDRVERTRITLLK